MADAPTPQAGAWTPPATGDDSTLLVRALGDMCAAYLGSTVVIRRGWQNAVSRPPASPWVQITPLAATRHATNWHVGDNPDPDPEQIVTAGAVSIVQPRSRRVQMDFFGPDAARWAHVISAALWDTVGCDFLAPYGVVPLETDDPRDLTGMEGNEQAVIRWMLETRLQCNTVVSLPQDYFSNVNLILRPQA